MLNKERKDLFLSQFTAKAKPKYTTIFENASPVEEKYGIDLAEFNNDQLSEVFQKRMGNTPLTIDIYLRKVRNYMKWCEEQGYESTANAELVTVDKSVKLRRQMVKSAEDLSHRFDEIFPPREEHTIDCIYRAFLWLIFVGLPQRDAINVLKSEVDLVSLTVNHDGCTYHLPVWASQDMYAALTIEVFTKHANVNGKAQMKRADSPYLISGIRASHIALSSINTAINERFLVSPYSLSLRQLSLSRRYIEVYETPEIDQNRMIEHHVDELFLQTKAGQTPDTEQSRGYRRCMKSSFKKQYKMWKQAFDLA